MATTTDYLNQLQTDKQTLVDNLNEKGVEASNSETFTELVPKVLDIQSGGDGSEYFTETITGGALSSPGILKSIKAIPSFTLNGTNIGYMFSGCSSLTSLDLSSYDTSNVTDMHAMFNGCSSLTTLDLSSFNTSNVANMFQMFQGCSSLTTLDVSNFDTSNATNIGYMFSDCSSLTSLDLSNFDTSNVTSTNSMLYNCTNLTTLIINNNNVFKMTSTNMLLFANNTSVYVPDDMVDVYKSATNWSSYANRIKPISELEGYNG